MGHAQTQNRIESLEAITSLQLMIENNRKNSRKVFKFGGQVQLGARMITCKDHQNRSGKFV